MAKLLYLGFPYLEEQRDRLVVLELAEDQPFVISDKGELIFARVGKYPIVRKKLSRFHGYLVEDLEEVPDVYPPKPGRLITTKNHDVARVMSFNADCYEDGSLMSMRQTEMFIDPEFSQLFPDGFQVVAEC